MSSSQLLPDESVRPFRGELQTQWLNQSRDVCRLRNTGDNCPTAPPGGQNLCIHLQEKRPVNKMISSQVQLVYKLLSLFKDTVVLDNILGNWQICWNNSVHFKKIHRDYTTQVCVEQMVLADNNSSGNH